MTQYNVDGRLRNGDPDHLVIEAGSPEEALEQADLQSLGTGFSPDTVKELPVDPDREFKRFHNALRILLNIDKWEAVKAGLDSQDWVEFKNDPYLFFIKANADQARRLFKLIGARQ